MEIIDMMMETVKSSFGQTVITLAIGIIIGILVSFKVIDLMEKRQ